jgi:hypothetical protein
MKRTLLRTGILTAVLAAGALPAGAIAMATAFDHAPDAPAVLEAAPEASIPPATNPPEHPASSVGADRPAGSTTTTEPSTEKPTTAPPSPPVAAVAHVGTEPAGPEARVENGEGGHEGAPTPVLRVFRLGCSARPASAGLGVVCEWGSPDGGAASYQLLRFTKGEGDSILPGSRVVLSSGTEHRFVDTTTEPGHVYRYSVIAFYETNTLIAHTALATVVVSTTPTATTTPKEPTTTPPAVRVSLHCSAPMVAGARRVTCEWGAGAGAASYVLRKGTNGAEAVTVAQVSASAPHQAFDTNVASGQVLVYSVTVLDSEGHQIGSATPVTLTVSPLEPNA